MTTTKRIYQFLMSRIHWLLLIIIFQVLLLILGFLDIGLSMESVLYIIACNIAFSLVFLLFAYMYETAFIKKLSEMHEVEELKHKELANTPLEQEILDYLYLQITQQKQIVSKQAVRLNQHEQSLTEFVHEMKTPLTALKLLIEEEHDGSRRAKLLFEWSRLNAMLDNQLYLARIETSDRDLYFSRVALKRMVIEEIQLTRHISQQKGLGFDLSFEDDYDIFTDKKWCKMMLRQVISNAVKYSDRGTEITISAYKKHDHVCLAIEDQGRGIPKQDIKRVFDRGFTSTNFRHETTSSGLGLYLVDEISKKLGTKVSLTSNVDQGTKVLFMFSNQNEMLERMSQVTKLSLNKD